MTTKARKSIKEEEKITEPAPMEGFIGGRYLQSAKSFEDIFRNGTDEEVQQILDNEFANGDPACIYGFMLYARDKIVKYYWYSRVMKTRYNKKPFFTREMYYEWLTNIFGVCQNKLYFGSPLKNFKPGKSAQSLASQFKNWFKWTLESLAREMKKEDQAAEGKDEDGTQREFSIDAASDTETGYDRYLDGEIASHSKAINPELDTMAERDTVNAINLLLKDPQFTKVVGNEKANPHRYSCKDFFRMMVDPEIDVADKSSVQKMADLMETSFGVARIFKETLTSLVQDYEIDFSNFQKVLSEDPYKIVELLR